MILAEGPSDIRVLRQALERMHPHLTDLISFFNHEELSVDGGANFVVKFLKAFAGANIADQVLAVFDNDTAGLMALKQTQALSLPPNLRATSLPECAMAKIYPTVGPQGRHDMDVNGLAASIEMYLGAYALTEGGALRPVRWTGYVPVADAYQGEVEGKRHVVDAFQKLLAAESRPAAAKAAFPDLSRVWDHLIATIEDAQGSPFLTAWRRSSRRPSASRLANDCWPLVDSRGVAPQNGASHSSRPSSGCRRSPPCGATPWASGRLGGRRPAVEVEIDLRRLTLSRGRRSSRAAGTPART